MKRFLLLLALTPLPVSCAPVLVGVVQPTALMSLLPAGITTSADAGGLAAFGYGKNSGAVTGDDFKEDE